MAYRLFVSHGFRDTLILERLRSSFSQPGIQLYVAEADPRYGESLPKKIEKAIDSADAVLVVMTKQASESASVNQEIGYAKKAGKQIIALVEQGASIGVLLQGIEYLLFSIDKLADAAERVVNYVETVVEKKKTRDDILEFSLILVSIAIIGLIALIYSRKKS